MARLLRKIFKEKKIADVRFVAVSDRNGSQTAVFPFPFSDGSNFFKLFFSIRNKVERSGSLTVHEGDQT